MIRHAYCLLVLQDDKALYTFKDGTEYVMDVGWSPIHPSLFASVDGLGKLSLWNLNSDTEVCIKLLAALDVVLKLN